MKVFYSVGDDETRFELETGLDLASEYWQDSIAEECADEYHSNHDGWEGRWPREFTLYASKDGPPIATFIVEREFEPTFSAFPRQQPSTT